MSVSVNRNMPKSARPQFRANGGGGGGAAPLSLYFSVTTWLDVFKSGDLTLQTLTIPANGFAYLKYYLDLKKLATKLGYDPDAVIDTYQRQRGPDKFSILSISPHAGYGANIMNVGWYTGTHTASGKSCAAVATVKFVNPTSSALTRKPYLDNPSNYKNYAICIHTQLLTTDPMAHSQSLPYINQDVAQSGVSYNISDFLYT